MSDLIEEANKAVRDADTRQRDERAIREAEAEFVANGDRLREVVLPLFEQTVQRLGGKVRLDGPGARNADFDGVFYRLAYPIPGRQDAQLVFSANKGGASNMITVGEFFFGGGPYEYLTRDQITDGLVKTRTDDFIAKASQQAN
jgi:hypothetical protein